MRKFFGFVFVLEKNPNPVPVIDKAVDICRSYAAITDAGKINNLFAAGPVKYQPAF